MGYDPQYGPAKKAYFLIQMQKNRGDRLPGFLITIIERHSAWAGAWQLMPGARVQLRTSS
jgi:hypothetical protein